jgi:rhomboid protease GluP
MPHIPAPQTSTPPPDPLHPAVARPLWGLIAAIALITALPELVFSLADAGLLGSPRWRPLGYQYGAFWAGLLYGWQPNFAAQPLTMFLSYAILHAGPVHLIGNLGALVWLGPRVAVGGGAGRFLMIWIGSAIGGGLAFGLMTSSPAPMIGASGAVSGLAGAWIVQDWQDRRRAGMALGHATWPALGMLALLVVINLIAWISEDGVLAWQTHLGGTLAGAALAAVWRGPARSIAQK